MALHQRSRVFLLLAGIGLMYFHETLATASKDACGEIIYLNKSEAKRSIDSKSYTHKTDLTNCSLEIVAPSFYVVVLNFSYLNVSNHSCCMTENVTVVSKLEKGVQHQHGTFSGTIVPQTIMSIGSTLKIMFSFASSASRFVANVDLDFNECAEYNGGCHHMCNNTIGGRKCACETGFKLQSNLRHCRKDSCGGLIFGQKYSSGLITSPEFPNTYPNHHKCKWEIISPPLHKIMLNFTYFYIEDGDKCTHDNVTIYSGLDVDDFYNHGSFCGTSKPPMIFSKRNLMTIKLSSNGANFQQGFVAVYHVIADECREANGGCQHNCVNTLSGHECSCHPGFALTNDKHACKEICGGHFLDFNGTIVSPLFPENYPSNQRCQWSIIAQKGYRIRLEFYHFDLEDSIHCDADSVTLYSRETVDINAMVGVFCGSKLPPVIDVDTRYLIIQFESDALFSHTGFVASYTWVDRDECAANNGGCQHECYNTYGSYKCACSQGFMLHPDAHACVNISCSLNLTDFKGLISSVHYPQNYPPNTNCLWHFKTKAGHKIQLTIVDLELEWEQKCLFDYLSIYDGEISDDTFKVKYCGTNATHALMSPIVTSGNEMVVEFRSDSSVQKRGFNASITSVCGGNLTATSITQDLYSHARYPAENYGKNLLCHWYIEAPPGRNIKFWIVDIQLEANCDFDYVQISEQLPQTNKTYGNYCGSNNFPEVTSQKNTLKIEFHTDYSNEYRGFAAKYIIV